MPVCLDVVVVLGAALYVHAAGVPVSLLRNTLRAPMSPDSELRVAKPVGESVRLQRFPVGPKRSCDRAAGKIAVRVCTLLAQRGFCGRKQTDAARNKLFPVETALFTIHFQVTLSPNFFPLLRPSPAAAVATPKYHSMPLSPAVRSYRVNIAKVNVSTSLVWRESCYSHRSIMSMH